MFYLKNAGAYDKNRLPSLSAIDPWLYAKLTKGEIPMDFTPPESLATKYRNKGTANVDSIFYLIKSQIDEYVRHGNCRRDGNFTEASFIGMDGELYFPKGDRFFVEIKDNKVLQSTWGILKRKFGERVSFNDINGLIQVLL